MNIFSFWIHFCTYIFYNIKICLCVYISILITPLRTVHLKEYNHTLFFSE